MLQPFLLSACTEHLFPRCSRAYSNGPISLPAATMERRETGRVEGEGREGDEEDEKNRRQQQHETDVGRLSERKRNMRTYGRPSAGEPCHRVSVCREDVQRLSLPAPCSYICGASRAALARGPHQTRRPLPSWLVAGRLLWPIGLMLGSRRPARAVLFLRAGLGAHESYVCVWPRAYVHSIDRRARTGRWNVPLKSQQDKTTRRQDKAGI